MGRSSNGTHTRLTWRWQDQNLHALMDAAAEEHVARLQRVEEASAAAVATAPSLAIDLVRPGALCSGTPLHPWTRSPPKRVSCDGRRGRVLEGRLAWRRPARLVPVPAPLQQPKGCSVCPEASDLRLSAQPTTNGIKVAERTLRLLEPTCRQSHFLMLSDGAWPPSVHLAAAAVARS